MVEQNIPAALILEDDFDFQANFKARLGEYLSEAQGLDWNLMPLSCFSRPAAKFLRCIFFHGTREVEREPLESTRIQTKKTQTPQGFPESTLDLTCLRYVGRSPMENDISVVSDHVVEPGYTLWTVGYILRLDAARALLETEAHQHMTLATDQSCQNFEFSWGNGFAKYIRYY